MYRAVLTLTCLVVFGGAFVPAQTPDRPAPQAPAAESPAPSDDFRLDLQKPEGETTQPAESWWQKVLRAAPHCKSFTDGCRTCSHTVCSNIGIACQPKEWSCNDADAKQEADPDAKPEPRQ